MEPYRDDDLTAALNALRPTPRPSFAAELDARVAAGFPRSSRLSRFSPAVALDRLRAVKPRQVLLPASAVAVTALLVATVVVVGQNSGSESDDATIAMESEQPGMPSAGTGNSAVGAPDTSSSGGASGTQYEAEVPSTEGAEESSAAAGVGQGSAGRNSGYAADAPKRAIERSAEITLGTEPENLGRASSEVFDVVHDYRGIVLRSRTSDGSAAHAEAEFELMIPSGRLGDAMGAFSGIAEVRSRHEATDDITAPTVTAGEQLEDSEARIDSLLAQLADAETESEREAVEAELRGERNRAATLRASLQNLERRASLSRVSLRIVGSEGASTGGGTWGVGDALDDAGRILAVGAAVALVALAVLGPIALIALLVWLTRRTWLRRARQSALG